MKQVEHQTVNVIETQISPSQEESMRHSSRQVIREEDLQSLPNGDTALSHVELLSRLASVMEERSLPSLLSVAYTISTQTEDSLCRYMSQSLALSLHNALHADDFQQTLLTYGLYTPDCRVLERMADDRTLCSAIRDALVYDEPQVLDALALMAAEEYLSNARLSLVEDLYADLRLHPTSRALFDSAWRTDQGNSLTNKLNRLKIDAPPEVGTTLLMWTLIATSRASVSLQYAESLLGKLGLDEDHTLLYHYFTADVDSAMPVNLVALPLVRTLSPSTDPTSGFPVAWLLGIIYQRRQDGLLDLLWLSGDTSTRTVTTPPSYFTTMHLHTTWWRSLTTRNS